MQAARCTEDRVMRGLPFLTVNAGSHQSFNIPRCRKNNPKTGQESKSKIDYTPYIVGSSPIPYIRQ